MSLHAKLSAIQAALKAPKNQRNDFAKFNYRTFEGICQAAKPLLDGCTLTVADDIVMVGDRIYVKATATIRLGDESLSVSAFAREALAKKGMDDSQITGCASSYARKYALNGLFLVDDSEDVDGMDNSQPAPTAVAPVDVLDESSKQWVEAINAGKNKLEEINNAGQRELVKRNLKK